MKKCQTHQTSDRLKKNENIVLTGVHRYVTIFPKLPVQRECRVGLFDFTIFPRSKLSYTIKTYSYRILPRWILLKIGSWDHAHHYRSSRTTLHGAHRFFMNSSTLPVQDCTRKVYVCVWCNVNVYYKTIKREKRTMGVREKLSNEVLITVFVSVYPLTYFIYFLVCCISYRSLSNGIAEYISNSRVLW